jgi:hypothetical protein
LDGVTITSNPKDVEAYNILQKENGKNRAFTRYRVEVHILSNETWRMQIDFIVPPKTLPIVCKMPYSEKLFPKDALQDSYIPSASLYLINKEVTHLYQTEFLNTGNFAITKVENGWIEGTFDADIHSCLGHENAKITNGSFRFKLTKQLYEND